MKHVQSPVPSTEYPAVPRGDSRFRFQVMADHTHEDIDAVVKALAAAMRAGTQEALSIERDGYNNAHGRAGHPAESVLSP